MKVLSLRLQDDLYERLRTEAFERRITISDIIREQLGGQPWQTIRKKADTKVASSASPTKLKAILPEPSGPSIESLKPTSILNPTNPRARSDLCKIHGTPLDGRGRCMTKGCKYG